MRHVPFHPKQRGPTRHARRDGVALLLTLSIGAVGLGGTVAWTQPAGRGTTSPPAEAPPVPAAPRLRFQHLSIEDGLSQVNVSAVLQDRQGFMWFGTQDGLNRYDGYRFTVYRPIPFDTTSLLDTGIMALGEDRAGAIWASVGGAAERLDPHTGRIRHYRHDPTSLAPGSVSAFHTDPSGALWLGAIATGLNRFDPSANRFRHYRHDPRGDASLSSDGVTAIHTDAGGTLWVATVNGLNRLVPGRDQAVDMGQFRRYLYDPGGVRPTGDLWTNLVPDSPAQRVAFVTALCEDPGARGVLWAATAAGLVRLNTRTGQTRRFTPDATHSDGNILSDVLPDPRTPGVLWVASLGSREHGGGLYHFDMRTERFTAYHHDPDKPTSLVADRLLGLYADRTGLVWVNPLSGGVDRFDPGGSAFGHGRRVPGEANSLSDDVVWAFAEHADGRLWIATSRGLDQLDRITGLYTSVRHGPPYVRSLRFDSAGTLWIGRSDGAVERMDPITGRATPFPSDRVGTSGLPPPRLDRFYEDRAGNLWVNARGGLSRLEPGGQAFTHVPFGPPLGQAHPLLEDAAGALWVITGSGLERHNRARGTVTTYRHDPHDESSLGSNIVITAHERASEPGVLWLGTQSGLDRLDTQTGRATHFTMRDGLPNPVIYGLLEDERGHLWMSTNNGLSEFDPERRTFTNYGPDAGVQAREFTTGYYRSPYTGELFFGGINGFNAFFPERITHNPHPPAVVLTGLRLSNRPVAVSEEVRLQPTEKSVTLEYVGLHYQDPARNRYRYQLEGFDADWVDAGTERTATYTNLDPGTYTFHVKAANSDGVWNEESASIRVVALPARWQTWWARLLGLLALTGLLWAAHRYQLARRLAVERLRTRIATDLHDDIGTGLTQVSLLSGLAHRSALQPAPEAAALAKQIGEEARTLAERMRDVVWMIRPDEDAWPALEARMRDAGTALLDPLEVAFEMRGEAVSPPPPLPTKVRRHVLLAYKEVLNNAARHAAPSRVEVTWRLTREWLVLRVCDDGRGFDPKGVADGRNEGGNGLRNLRLRATEVGGTVVVESESGAGTCVTFTVPLGRKRLPWRRGGATPPDLLPSML